MEKTSSIKSPNPLKKELSDPVWTFVKSNTLLYVKTKNQSLYSFNRKLKSLESFISKLPSSGPINRKSLTSKKPFSFQPSKQSLGNWNTYRKHKSINIKGILKLLTPSFTSNRQSREGTINRKEESK